VRQQDPTGSEIQSDPEKGQDGSRGQVETMRARQRFDAKQEMTAEAGKTTKAVTVTVTMIETGKASRRTTASA
jgi:hypothetical protein